MSSITTTTNNLVNSPGLSNVSGVSAEISNPVDLAISKNPAPQGPWISLWNILNAAPPIAPFIKDVNMRTSIDFVSFNEFTPPPPREKVEIGDEVLKKYIEKVSYKIVAPEQFRKLVLEEAQKLGFTPEQIANLSIHDAVELSTRITAERLEYNKAMIGDNLFFDQPPEAKRIDEMSEDQVFAEGKGVCRNYAKVNCAVFSVLKELNQNLTNTYITSYDLNSKYLVQLILLPHAWNQVITVTKDKITGTFVDPTWLDTRSKTADASGAKEEGSENEFINALDPSHFGGNYNFLRLELADFYARTANFYQRKNNPQLQRQYLLQAINLYEEVLSDPKIERLNPNSKERTDFKMLSLFKEAHCLFELGGKPNYEKAIRLCSLALNYFPANEFIFSFPIYADIEINFVVDLAKTKAEGYAQLLEKAIKTYEKIPEGYPRPNKVQSKRAECLIIQGKVSKAIEIYESLARSNDEQATFRYYNAGDTLMEYGYLKEAKSFFEKFLTILPNSYLAPDAREKLETISRLIP